MRNFSSVCSLGKSKSFVELPAEAIFPGQQKICQAEVRVPGIFKSDAVLMRAVGEVGEFGEIPMEIARAVGTRKLRKFDCFIACTGNLVHEWSQGVQRGANGVGERPFEPLANFIPIRFPGQHKPVHPAIALA